MDIEKILRSFFNQNPRVIPWQLSFDEAKGSEEALRVWLVLNQETRFLISQASPFRRKRKAILRALRQQGVSPEILSQLCGLSTSSIIRICGRQKETDNGDLG